MFTSHLSYRARSLPSAQTERPPPASRLSPQCFPPLLSNTPGYDTNKVRAETAKPQDADDATLKSTADGEQTKGRCLWKNVYYELERLSIMLSTINPPPQRLT